DRNARKRAEGGDSLLALAHVAGAVRLALVDARVARTALEADAPHDERGIGALGSAHDDPIDVDALTFAHHEANARASAVGRKVEERAHLGESEALFLERVEHPVPGRFDLRLRNRAAEVEIGFLREVLIDQDLVSLERHVVKGGARPELDGYPHPKA